MDNNFHWDLARAAKEGLHASIGRRMNTGKLLEVDGFKQTVEAMSDPLLQARYAEIGIKGQGSTPTTFVLTTSLRTNPHVFIGYSIEGYPILLGATKALEGHLTVMGPTRTGKSTLLAIIVYQLSRLGFPVVFVGLKSLDAIIMASMRAGAESLTRISDKGNRVAAPFAYCTLQTETKTKGVNVLLQRGATLQKWLRTANLVKALSRGKGEMDPNLAYFETRNRALLQSVPDWGKSFRELSGILAAMKLDRDTNYATSGLQGEIAQQAVIEQLNLSEDHPANVDLLKIIEGGGCFYFDASYMDVGGVATAASALVAQAAIFAKRRSSHLNDKLLFLVIDEAQQVPRSFLTQSVEQCAGSGIRLILAYHNLEQMGDQAETMAMTQCKIITGATPGSKTDKFLQSLFGTKKAFSLTINQSDSSSASESSTQTTGPSGNSVSLGQSLGKGQQSGFGLSEKECFVWEANDTLELNNNREMYVLQVSPGAEFSHYGNRPILCLRGGAHMTFDEINKVAEDTLKNTPDTFLPGALKLSEPKRLELPAGLAEKRSLWLAVLNRAAAQIRSAQM